MGDLAVTSTAHGTRVRGNWKTSGRWAKTRPHTRVPHSHFYRSCFPEVRGRITTAPRYAALAVRALIVWLRVLGRSN